MKGKTHRSAAKRFRTTGTGRLMRRRAGSSHLLSKKSSSRKRRLKRCVPLTTADRKRIRRLLPG